jgi:hypothetical protein
MNLGNNLQDSMYCIKIRFIEFVTNTIENMQYMKYGRWREILILLA